MKGSTATRRAFARTSSSSSATSTGVRSEPLGGDEGIQTLENDTGPDDANHARRTASTSSPGRAAEARAPTPISGIAPTVLEILEIEQLDGSQAGACSPRSPAR